MTSPRWAGGSFAARICIASARAATVIPTRASGSGTVRGAAIRSAAGRCPGDSQEGRYGTDLPGDQLTGTLPVEVHAGRSELLQEHVDLAVEPRTSRHVASLPPSRHGARPDIRTAPYGTSGTTTGGIQPG